MNLLSLGWNCTLFVLISLFYHKIYHVRYRFSAWCTTNQSNSEWPNCFFAQLRMGSCTTWLHERVTFGIYCQHIAKDNHCIHFYGRLLHHQYWLTKPDTEY